MSRRCTVCNHPERDAIDSALVSGASSNRRTASQYGFSEASVRRHREHIPQELVKAQEAREIVSADDLLSQVDELRGRALGILAQAEASGKFTAALSAIREARGCLELQARMISAALHLEREDERGYAARLSGMSDEEFADEVLDFIRPAIGDAQPCPLCGGNPRLSDEFSREKGS